MEPEQSVTEPVRSTGRLGWTFDMWDRVAERHPFAAGLTIRIVVSILLDKVFDHVLTPWAQIEFGPIGGIAVITVASAIICLLFLLHYQHHKKDTYGLEAEKVLMKQKAKVDISDKVHSSKLWALAALLVLPILTDPFTALVRIRKAHSYEMNAGYWNFFMTAVLIGNIGWGIWVAFWIWLVTILYQMVWSQLGTLEEVYLIVLVILGALTASILFCFVPKPQKPD